MVALPRVESARGQPGSWHSSIEARAFDATGWAWAMLVVRRKHRCWCATCPPSVWYQLGRMRRRTRQARLGRVNAMWQCSDILDTLLVRNLVSWRVILNVYVDNGLPLVAAPTVAYPVRRPFSYEPLTHKKAHGSRASRSLERCPTGLHKVDEHRPHFPTFSSCNRTPGTFSPPAAPLGCSYLCPLIPAPTETHRAYQLERRPSRGSTILCRP